MFKKSRIMALWLLTWAMGKILAHLLYHEGAKTRRYTKFINSLDNISNTKLKGQVNQSTAYFAALALIDSIEETLDESRISDSVQEQISQPGIQLLDLMYSPDSNEEEVEVIYSQFFEKVISYLKSDQLVGKDGIDLILSIINADEGPRTEFIDEIESGMSAISLVEAHNSFRENISEIISENNDYGNVNIDVLTDFIYLAHIH